MTDGSKKQLRGAFSTPPIAWKKNQHTHAKVQPSPTDLGGQCDGDGLAGRLDGKLFPTSNNLSGLEGLLCLTRRGTRRRKDEGRGGR